MTPKCCLCPATPSPTVAGGGRGCSSVARVHRSAQRGRRVGAGAQDGEACGVFSFTVAASCAFCSLYFLIFL